MNRAARLAALSILLTSLAASAAPPDPKTVTGVWTASLVPFPGKEVSCVLRITATRDGLAGTIRNGDMTERLSSVAWDGVTLRLNWDHYDAKVEARAVDGALAGTYVLTRPTGTIEMPFAATRTPPAMPPKPAGSGVGGEWSVDLGDSKLKGVFRQKGSGVTGTLLSDTGDYGPLHGTFDGRNLLLTVFNGFFAYRFDATLEADGSLKGEFRSRKGDPTPWHATRTRESAPVAVVTSKEPNTPFRFSLPDADGKIVSSEDARFAGHPIIVTIMGTWCPNCHDEAPVLAELFRKYGPKGLEVVALAYEYTDDVERSRRQMKRFAERYGISYTSLLGGTTKSAPSSPELAQLAGWKGYPTSLFLDRRHHIVKAHSGFDGPATGERFTALKKEMEETVRGLVAAR